MPFMDFVDLSVNGVKFSQSPNGCAQAFASQIGEQYK